MLSFFRFVRSLRGRARWHATPARGVTGSVTYAVRSLRQWRLHDRWLATLETPALVGVATIDHELIERYQHRYISLFWPRATRLRAIQDHYEFALARFPRPLLHMLYRERSVELGKVGLKEGSSLTVILRAPLTRGREGELSISLVDAAGLQISYTTLSIIDDGRTIVIGCLQGAANKAGPDVVRDLTRACHGLRPKNLLLSIVRALAEAFGVTRVLGVSNRAHVFARIKGKVKADYDAFWIEAGGVAVDHGFFELPPREPHRCASHVESKRRSEFRRREALRNDVCELVVAAFGIERSSHRSSIF